MRSKRPNKRSKKKPEMLTAYDENMNEYEIEGEELMARAICHELAHLDGDLYIDHIEGELMDVVAGEE